MNVEFHYALGIAAGENRPEGVFQLILQLISNPAVNDWPLAARRTEIEKVRPVCLQVSKEKKAAHHAGVVGVLFCPPVVFAKDRLSRLFF